MLISLNLLQIDIPKEIWNILPVELLFILLIIFLLVTNSEKLAIAYDKIKGWEKKKLIVNLKIHDMFITIEKVRKISNSQEYTTFNEGDEIKTMLLNHLINLKLNFMQEKIIKFLDDSELKKNTNQELKFKIGIILNEIIEDYSKISLKDFIRAGISEKDGKFLIDAYKNYRQDINDGMKERIESICSNADYSSNYARISAILEVLTIVLYTIPGDTKETLNEINGRFKTYSNKNINLIY